MRPSPEMCSDDTIIAELEYKLDKTLRLLAESERRMNDPAWRSAVWEALGHPGNNPAQPFGKRESALAATESKS